MNSDLKMWFDGYDWYIASSTEEAKKLQIELTGEDKYRDETNEFRLVDPNSELVFVDNGKREKKKVNEWIAARSKGFFASIEF